MGSDRPGAAIAALGCALGAISLLVLNALQGPTILTNVILVVASALLALGGSAIASSSARRPAPGRAPYGLLALNVAVAVLCVWMLATGHAGAGFGP